MDIVKLSKDSHELLERLADRLPSDQLETCRTFSKVGEWGELIELMSAILVKRQVLVTPAERDALADLLYRYEIPLEDYDYITNRDETLAALNVEE